MKNNITLLFALFTTIVFSQNFSGTAFYQWKQSSKDFENTVLADPKMNPAMRKIIEARMSKLFNKTFILNFDKNLSIYQEEEKLNIKNDNGSGSWSPNGLVLSNIKNLKEKQYIANTDLMSKIFNVQSDLQNFKWELLSETKKIGNYLCNKATCTIAVSEIESNDYQKEKAAQEKNKTQFINLKEPQDKKIEVWYTTEIAVNHGPDIFWGLPGLILEINDGITNIVCSKLSLNSNQKLKIKIPKGQKISQQEFNLLVEQKNKELESVDFTK